MLTAAHICFSQIDTFHLQCADLGKFSQIKIEQNNRGLSSDWHLATVEIVNTATGESAIFPYNNWLNKKVGLSAIVYPDIDGDGIGDKIAAANMAEYTVKVITSDVRWGRRTARCKSYWRHFLGGC